METVTDFIFHGSKITANGDCSHEIKRLLLLGRKVIINPRLHIKKQRHYLANRSLSSQSYGFPVVMYGCETWTIKKAVHWRFDAFELWCWRRLENPLVSQDFKQVNPKGEQSWVFTGSTDAEAEAPILCPPDVKSWLISKDPDAGKDWGQEEKGRQRIRCWMASPTQWTWVDMSKLRELVVDREAWHAAVHGAAKSWTWLSNWTELNWWT